MTLRSLCLRFESCDRRLLVELYIGSPEIGAWLARAYRFRWLAIGDFAHLR